MSIEEKIKELGLELPNPSKPIASYVSVMKVGNILYLSGHGPEFKDGKPVVTGKVGKDLTEEEGYKVAQGVALNLLATIKSEMGDLNKVSRIIKLLGFVNSAPGYTRQPWVINGASDLLVKIFGEVKGKHARSALSANELPMNIPVEIEMIAEIQQ